VTSHAGRMGEKADKKAHPPSGGMSAGEGRNRRPRRGRVRLPAGVADCGGGREGLNGDPPCEKGSFAARGDLLGGVWGGAVAYASRGAERA
jgi:hypothetical protein